MIVERSPERRRGGYFIALFGAGRIAAERLGMLAHLHDRQSRSTGWTIDRAGGKRPGMTYADVPGRPWLMLRGDVEAAAFQTLSPDVEIRFATVPAAIEQDDDGVDVTLLNTVEQTSVTERFDLVVGCDGLRSTVRQLVFGPHEQYLVRLNYMVAAYQFPGATLAGLTLGEAAILHEPGRSMWAFAFADHDPTILLTYRTDDVDTEFTETPAQRVRAAFGPDDFGATLGDAINGIDSADGVLFDSAEQVHMDIWRKGRVVLVGDSAWCTTLYAGMGVSAGLMGADLLGAMLERHDTDVTTALRNWERSLRPYIDDYQRMGRDQRRFFVQKNRWELVVQRTMLRLLTHPIGQRLLGRFKPNAGEATTVDIVAIATRSTRHTEPAHT